MPLIVSSVINSEDMEPYITDTDTLTGRNEKQVGFIIIDEGVMQEPSTIVDMTGAERVIIRQSRHELKE